MLIKNLLLLLCIAFIFACSSASIPTDNIEKSIEKFNAGSKEKFEELDREISK